MKVKKEDVKYLVFEGGGGKGIVYLGAIEALEEMGILAYKTQIIKGQQIIRLDPSKIKGIAGTSVGSLTALLIASGHTPQEIRKVLMSDLSEMVLDTVEYGKLPTIFTSENPRHVIADRPIDKDKLLLDKYWKNFKESEEKKFRDLLKVPVKAFTQFNMNFFAGLVKWYLDYESKKKVVKEPKHEIFNVIQEIAKTSTTKSAIDKILDSSADSMNSLKYEYGLFLSEVIRDAADIFIEHKSGIKNCTFKQFYDEFNIDLVVTAYDVTSNELYYFRNNETWKDLCVADAIRMSISIPLVFKPVLMNFKDGEIKPVSDDLSSVNYVVDGGLGNNFPLHAFDDPSSAKLNPNVLGFTLRYAKEVETIQPTFFGYLENIFMSLIKQTSNLQFKYPNERDQAIELNSGKINVFDFSFKNMPESIFVEARRRTFAYFKD